MPLPQRPTTSRSKSTLRKDGRGLTLSSFVLLLTVRGYYHFFISLKSARILSSTVKTEGKNPFGEVSSALLVLEGFLQPARLWDDTAIFPSSPFPSFEVEITLQAEHSSQIPSLRVPFFADYILSNDKLQTNGTDQVFLLFFFNSIALVLAETGMPLKGAIIYRRIGILEPPQGLGRVYDVNLMRGEISKLAII